MTDSNDKPSHTTLGMDEALETIKRVEQAFANRGMTINSSSSLLGMSQSLSLFGDRQLVEARIPSGKLGKDGAQSLRVIATRAADSADVLTIVTLPYLDAMTQKAAWFSALIEAGVALKIYLEERAALPNWIGQRLALQGKSLPMLIREHRVWGPRERLIGPALLHVTEGALDRGLARAVMPERRAKGLPGSASANFRSGITIDSWDGFLDLAMIVARR
jgi:DNA polymerase III delta subunit